MIVPQPPNGTFSVASPNGMVLPSKSASAERRNTSVDEDTSTA